MIRQAVAGDSGILAELAAKLWESRTPEELAGMFAGLLGSGGAACFLACHEGSPAGFAQCQLRHDYVEGTRTSPVGYLEGIFVLEEFRRRGLARRLMAACEDWARSKGCSEFASDCELDNDANLRFHLGLGFAEANRVICFKKEL